MNQGSTKQFRRASTQNLPSQLLHSTDLRWVSKLVIWTYVPLLVLLWIYKARADDQLSVLLPLVAIASLAGIFWFSIKALNRNRVSYFELGVFYFFVVLLYSMYPLLGYLISSGEYSLTNDIRLYLANPTSDQFCKLAWWHFVYLLTFGASYLLSRGRSSRPPSILKPHASEIATCVVLYVAIRVFFLFLQLLYDLNPETYSESYIILADFPLIVRQLAGHLQGMLPTLDVLLIVALFADYRRFKIVIWLWIAAVSFATFARLWARTDLFLLLLCSVISYHRLVRPLRRRVLCAFALVGFLLFQLLGFLRYGLELKFSLANSFRVNSEFESIFANGFDLLNHAPGVLRGEWEFYLSDLTALVPQQFLPFEKFSPSIWYLNNFHPAVASSGSGLAFGVISEAVVGFGLIDVVWRALILGFIFGLIHRFHSSGKAVTFLSFAFYLWVTVLSYQAFRNTTLYLLVLGIYRFVPVLFAVKLVGEIFADRAALSGSEPSPASGESIPLYSEHGGRGSGAAAHLSG